MGFMLSIILRCPFQSPTPQSARQRLLTSLKGATVTVPNLQRLFRSWPQGVNSEVDRLNEDVERKLKSYVF